MAALAACGGGGLGGGGFSGFGGGYNSVSMGGDLGQYSTGGGGDFMGVLGGSGMMAMLPQMMSMINTGGGRTAGVRSALISHQVASETPAERAGVFVSAAWPCAYSPMATRHASLRLAFLRRRQAVIFGTLGISPAQRR